MTGAYLCAHCIASDAKMTARPLWRPQYSFSAKSSFSQLAGAQSEAMPAQISTSEGPRSRTAHALSLRACTERNYKLTQAAGSRAMLYWLLRTYAARSYTLVSPDVCQGSILHRNVTWNTLA